MLRVVVAETLHGRAVAPGDHRAVVDRLVGASVEEDRPGAHQHRQDRHVDVGDRREQQRVLATDQLRHPLLDLLVQHGASEETGPGGVGAPSAQVLGHGGDDLGVEVEPEVVAGCEVEEPAVADADPPTVLFVDHCVEHRMRVLQPSQVGDGLHPALEPPVGLPAKRLRADDAGDDRIALTAAQSVFSAASEDRSAGGTFGERHE
jgi:hypothetical protein